MTTQNRSKTVLTLAIRSLAPLALLAAAFIAGPTQAASIGVDFVSKSPGGTMGPADTAGVISQANWTTVVPGATLDLKDSDGNPTTMDITATTQQGVFQVTNAFTAPDILMMRDGLFRNSPGVSITVDLAEIPYNQYDLYVYLGHDGTSSGRLGSVTTDNSGTTYFYRNGSSLNSYVQATETGSSAASVASNYALFEGLTGSNLKITATAEAVQVFITGFQVVDAAQIPEPSTLVLAVLGLCGLISCGRRRRQR